MSPKHQQWSKLKGRNQKACMKLAILIKFKNKPQQNTSTILKTQPLTPPKKGNHWDTAIPTPSVTPQRIHKPVALLCRSTKAKRIESSLHHALYQTIGNHVKVNSLKDTQLLEFQSCACCHILKGTRKKITHILK